jgi:hypothetical protein
MPGLKWLIVRGLEVACCLTHPLQRLPWVNWYASCWLATWSGHLEDRWETGAWKAADPDDPDMQDKAWC